MSTSSASRRSPNRVSTSTSGAIGPGFLRGLIEQYGGFDIVIDDGSHWYRDQSVSLDVLWPALSEGGVYLVEDVHTSYLATYEGGRGEPNTFIGAVKERIDDLHGFWIDGQAPLAAESQASDGSAINQWTTTLAGIHVYDSVVVFDKATRGRPVRRMTGRPAFETLYDHPVEGFIDDDHRAQPPRSTGRWPGSAERSGTRARHGSASGPDSVPEAGSPARVDEVSRAH